MTPARIMYGTLLMIGAAITYGKLQNAGVFVVAAIFYLATSWLI